ncbi:MAG: DoxX family protein [Propioniciclava sp.]
MASSLVTALPHDWRDWIGLAARMILGGVLLVAGLLKIGNLGESVFAVQAYRILPYDLTIVVGYALPLIEIFIGLLLVTGLFTRLAGLVGGLLMVAFIVGIASAWSRGLSLDCGCFGGGGKIPLEEALAAYPWEIARDVGLLALGAWLVVRPRTPLSLDNLMRPSRRAEALGEDEDPAPGLVPSGHQLSHSDSASGDN